MKKKFIKMNDGKNYLSLGNIINIIKNKNIKEPLCFTLRVPSPLPLSYNRLQILTDKSHRLHQTIFLIFFDKHIFI